MITAYEFARWAHVLIMGYWLGSEFVINAASWYFVRATHLAYPERRALWDFVIDVDQHVRNALILIMPFGFTLAAQLGASPVTGAGLVGIWAFSAVWFAAMWASHLTLGRESAAFWRRLDGWMRLGVAIVVLPLGAVSLILGAPFVAGWLAAKLILYGAIICCGIAIRVYALKVYAVFPAYAAAGTATPEMECAIHAGVKGATLVIVGLWAMAFAAGYLGAAKPF